MSSKVPLLEAKNVFKTFDTVVKALDNVSIAVNEREIVSVIGENGAGKSTLMKILVGVYPPDAGELYYKGRKIPFPKNPMEAMRRGITIVYQEGGVIPHIKVYQYLLFGLEECFTRFGRLQLGRIFNLVTSVFEELGMNNVDVTKYMFELSPPIRKITEIARAILSVRLLTMDACASPEFNPIIILDEPTAPLSIEERDELLSYLLRLKKTASFIFVSHIIPEVMRFSDRIYVLRDGKLVAEHNLLEEKINEELIFKEIVGREISRYSVTSISSKREIRGMEEKQILLFVEKLTKEGYFKDVSFELRQGECLGLFGPTGSGKSEVAKCIYGLLFPDSGKIYFNGIQIPLKEDPGARLSRGIGYFSGETGKELFLYWPIRKNFSIINLDKVSKGLFKSVIDIKAEKSLSEKLMKKLRIKAPSIDSDCYSLSGGNKQKVSVGKWLERAPKILILENPTIGIDVGAREEIYEVLLEMKKSGMSMIVVSDDPKEYILLCDRILVMNEGVPQGIYTIEEYRRMMEI